MSDEADRWRMIRHMLAVRSGHRCEYGGCQLGPGNEGTVHHRMPKGMGGTSLYAEDWSRLVLLCGGAYGGTVGCHGDIESYRANAKMRGFIVLHGEHPETVPLVLWSGRRVYLTDDAPLYLLPPLGEPAWDIAAAV